MPEILCFGDSNTHGTAPIEVLGTKSRHSRTGRWPDVMAARLGTDYHVVAEGLPGRTTVHDDTIEGGLRNGVQVLPSVLQSHCPIDLCILMLGTNDLKPQFGVGAFDIARSIDRLANEIMLSGVVENLLLVSPVPVKEIGSLKDVFAGAEQASWLGHAYCEHRNAYWVPICKAGDYVTVSDMDGVHWEPESHRAFGQVMATEVQKCFNT